MELHVRVVSARNLLDKQTFGRQDPYCKVSVGGRKFRTRVHDNGHKTPAWNEKFVFQVYDPQLEQLHIQVKDKNFTASVLIGEVRLPVNMFLHGGVTDQWYTLNNGSKRAGEINLRVQLVGSVGNGKPSVVYPVAASVPVAAASYAYAPQAYAPPPPPPPQWHQPPAYPQPQYMAPPPPPPPMYYVPPPPVITAPPTFVYGAPGYHGGHHHHGYRGRHRGGMGGAGEMALGVGAGVVGGMLLGEALEGLFD